MIRHNPFPNSLSGRRLRGISGQTLVEYALVIVFISVVAISVLMAMGNQAANTYTTINHQLAAAGTTDTSSAPARSH